VMALLGMGNRGEPGVEYALAALEGKFVEAVGDERESGEAGAQAEFERMILGAEDLLDEPTPTARPDSKSTNGGQRAQSAAAEPQPRLWKATDMRGAAPVRWLARNRVPRGAVNLLIGDEGIGKSLFWVYLAAAVTTGGMRMELGIPQRDPAHVLVVATEDDWSTTVRPRLEVAGADLNMMHVICVEADGSGAPVFPDDLGLIYSADPAPALVVVDAWLDTVPAKLSVKDPQQARQALHPFREVATVTDAAVQLLTHTNRVASPNARDRYGITGELRKKVRMSLWAQRNEEGHLLVGPEKTNMTVTGIPASTFKIEKVQFFAPTNDNDGTVPKLVYVGESDRTATDFIVEAYHERKGANSSDDAVAWLADCLSAGPRWSHELYNAAEEAGYSADQAKRAKKKLRVESGKDGLGQWFWKLPGQEGCPPTFGRRAEDVL
jgi:hypothetical protein